MTAEDLYPLALAIVNEVAEQRCGVTMIAAMVVKGRAAD